MNGKKVSNKEKETKKENISVKKNSKKTKAKTEKLKIEIDDLNNKLNESEDKLLRLKAEYENYRKRISREVINAGINARADTILPILQVYDHFKMAVAAAETSDDMEIVKQGLTMINSEFSKAMDELGVKEVNSIGQKFDPNCHEAVAKENSEEEEDTIIKQWQPGYMLGDKLLRPATVVVSSGQIDESPEENE